MRWRSPTEQPPHLALGIERQAVVLRDLRQPRRHFGEAFLAVEAERDVFGDRQIFEQREMLKHHADAERARLARAGELDLLSHPADFAGGRLNQAVHHLDQRRFAGAVFAEQRVDLARKQIEVDGIVGREGAVAFGDANGLQQRCFRGGILRRHWIQHDVDGLERKRGGPGLAASQICQANSVPNPGPAEATNKRQPMLNLAPCVRGRRFWDLIAYE